MGQLINKHKKSSTAVLFVSFLITFCLYPYMNEEDTTSSDNFLNVFPLKGIFKAKEISFNAKFFNFWNYFVWLKGFARTLLSVNESQTYISTKEYNSSLNYDLIYSNYQKRFSEVW